MHAVIRDLAEQKRELEKMMQDRNAMVAQSLLFGMASAFVR